MTQTTELNEKELAFLAHLESKMADMDELPGGLQALIYGDSGVGKTAAAMMLATVITPSDKLILHIDTAQGYKVRRNHDILMQRDFKRISFTTRTDLMKLGELISRKAGFLSDVGAIIFDEDTSMAEDTLAATVRERRPYKSPDSDPNATSQPDFGQAGDKHMEMVNKFARLDGMHCIRIGHLRSDTTPNGGVAYSPSYTPKLSTKIRQPMDLVTFLTVREDGERIFRNHPMKGIAAKSRVKGLEPETNFDDLADRVKAWLINAKAEPEQQDTITPMDMEI